jgi:sugar/nucleoside kinase (ribokinase family)
MEIAKEAGALLSYDPNLREALWPSREEARTKILSIWDQADIVKVSEVELEFLTGIDSVEDDVVMKLWRPTMKLLLVTLGDQGCKYYARVCASYHLMKMVIYAECSWTSHIQLHYVLSLPKTDPKGKVYTFISI